MAARVTLTLNEDVLANVIAELRLTNPPTFTMNARSDMPHPDVAGDHALIRGLYDPVKNHVAIASQGYAYEREGFYVLTKHVRHTILHELRHAWQREYWTPEQQEHGRQGGYRQRPEEIDANQWAEFAAPRYPNLVKVTRQQVGRSGFSRMSEAADRRQP